MLEAIASEVVQKRETSGSTEFDAPAGNEDSPDADDAPGGASHVEPDHKKRNWIVRFASILGLASAGQGGGPGLGGGPMGGSM